MNSEEVYLGNSIIDECVVSTEISVETETSPSAFEECTEDRKPILTDIEISKEELHLKEEVQDLIETNLKLNKRKLNKYKLNKKEFQSHVFDSKSRSFINPELSNNKTNNDWNSLHEELNFKITKVIFPKKKTLDTTEEKMESTSNRFESKYTSDSDSSMYSSPDDFYGFDNEPGTSGSQSSKSEHSHSNDVLGSSENDVMENREFSQNKFYRKKQIKSKREQEKADLLFARQLHGSINRNHLKRMK